MRGWGWRHASRRDFAVAGLDLEIEPGERVLLLGSSGSGKTTLLHGIAGLLGGSEEGEETGAVLLDGELARESRPRVGLVLQDPDSQAVLARVGDDVAFGLENLGVPRDEIARRVRPALDAVGLDVALDRSTSALSGGQKQRLALAGVLAMQPDLLLLDEPTANLDPDGVVELRDAVVRTLGSRTLIVIEHRVATWWPVVTRVIVLGRQGVIADGAPDAVLASHRAELDAAGIWLPDSHAAVDAPGPAVTGEVLLSAHELTVGRVAAVPVATGITAAVVEGSALAVTGPNGVGKSTLALTLAGLLPARGGELEARERLRRGLGAQPIKWRSRDLLTRLGTVFQSPEHQFLTATVRRELEIGPRALGLDEAQISAVVGELLERLGLTRLERAHPFSLSGGEKRRLSVATVLATAPSVIVLDEPTFGQDARTWRELVGLLREQRDAGRAIVAVTHDREVVQALCDREYAMSASGVPTGEREARP